ncbi:hypothetical protein LGK95_22230 [Clostridium algoriphilum]|uniref:hypothetical protein n=1 Tax=Clostridium algoriphilum TaxID=198347 RepID=UPI001CF54C8C|nr:hypothetical protein [Clostridium algoriphilum]MCB2296162.1 hypothetical protein [Clostridium algoriphilum]
MQKLIILSFIFFTALVGVYTYFKIKGNNRNKQSKDSYFLGGRSLRTDMILVLRKSFQYCFSIIKVA